MMKQGRHCQVFAPTPHPATVFFASTFKDAYYFTGFAVNNHLRFYGMALLFPGIAALLFF
jgi:hypothetical protein